MLGPVGVDWTTRERPPSLVHAGVVGEAVVAPEILCSGTVLGQAVSARAEVELLWLLRQNEDELEAHLVDVASVAFDGNDGGFEDPFGFGGDFDLA